MKTTKFTIFAAAALAAAALHAEREIGFGVNAFWAVRGAAPQNRIQNNAVFSPFGFELDCCVMAEAFDSIGRANTAEIMGVLTDFNTVYPQLIEKYDGSLAATNGFSFLSARALCLPNVFQANVDYRKRIAEMNGASVCLDFPIEGAQSWFRAKMDGEMEDFYYPVTTKHDRSRYRFIDVISAAAQLGAQSPATIQKGEFNPVPEEKLEIDFIKTRADIAYRKMKNGIIVRVPLKGGAYLYAYTPFKGVQLSDLAETVNGEKVQELLASIESVTLGDCAQTVADVYMPAMDFMCENDMRDAFMMAKIPESGFVNIDNALQKRTALQYMRFRLLPGTPDEGAEPPKPAPGGAQSFTFNRPFLFIVYFPDSNVIPAMGMFSCR